MSFSRPKQWYHSHSDPIWPDSTLKEPVYLSVVGGPGEEESVKVQAELTDVTRNSNFILTRRLTYTKPNFQTHPLSLCLTRPVEKLKDRQKCLQN